MCEGVWQVYAAVALRWRLKLRLLLVLLWPLLVLLRFLLVLLSSRPTFLLLDLLRKPERATPEMKS